METGESKMNPNKILKVPSFIISKIEGSFRLIDMSKSIESNYGYTNKVKDILLEQDMIKLSYIQSKVSKLYEITDKGKEIQGHLRFIIGKLSEVRK